MSKYLKTIPETPTFTQKGLKGYQFPLEQKRFEVYLVDSTKGHDVFKSSTRPLLKIAAIIAEQHHEHWDGNGYPHGLKQEEINIAARIVSITDVFDALTHDRCYKEAWPVEKAFDYIQDKSGSMFDPELVKLFTDNKNQFLDIRDSLKDK